jgi:hypothetical protein
MPYHERALFIFAREGGGKDPVLSNLRLKSAEIVRKFMPPNTTLVGRGLEVVHDKLFAVPLQPGSYRLSVLASIHPAIDATTRKATLQSCSARERLRISEISMMHSASAMPMPISTTSPVSDYL